MSAAARRPSQDGRPPRGSGTVFPSAALTPSSAMLQRASGSSTSGAVTGAHAEGSSRKGGASVTWSARESDDDGSCCAILCGTVAQGADGAPPVEIVVRCALGTVPYEDLEFVRELGAQQRTQRSSACSASPRGHRPPGRFAAPVPILTRPAPCCSRAARPRFFRRGESLPLARGRGAGRAGARRSMCNARRGALTPRRPASDD
jgi:hypothetical protein